MINKLNPEDFTNEAAEITSYDDLVTTLEWLHKVPKENLVYLLVAIVQEADNKEELLEFITNYFEK